MRVVLRAGLEVVQVRAEGEPSPKETGSGWGRLTAEPAQVEVQQTQGRKYGASLSGNWGEHQNLFMGETREACLPCLLIPPGPYPFTLCHTSLLVSKLGFLASEDRHRTLIGLFPVNKRAEDWYSFPKKMWG